VENTRGLVRITQNHTDTANVSLGHGHLAKQRTTAHSPTHADEIEHYSDCRAIWRRLACGEGQCIRAVHKNTNETPRIHTRPARYTYNRSVHAQTQARSSKLQSSETPNCRILTSSSCWNHVFEGGTDRSIGRHPARTLLPSCIGHRRFHLRESHLWPLKSSANTWACACLSRPRRVVAASGGGWQPLSAAAAPRAHGTHRDTVVPARRQAAELVPAAALFLVSCAPLFACFRAFVALVAWHANLARPLQVGLDSNFQENSRILCLSNILAHESRTTKHKKFQILPNSYEFGKVCWFVGVVGGLEWLWLFKLPTIPSDVLEFVVTRFFVKSGPHIFILRHKN